MLDQCSRRSLLATEDLVLDDVVLLAIRKQAFRESEKPIRGCQYDLEPSRPFRLTEYGIGGGGMTQLEASLKR